MNIVTQSTHRTPKVSVIMPTYNHEKFVGAAIESVLNQTFQDFELVIMDDGSKDRTPEVVAGYSDPRIRFVPSPRNRGVCATLNDCIRMARGEYIAELNSDDLCKPDRLEKQVAWLDAHPETGVVFSYAEIINDEGGPHEDTSHFYHKVFLVPNRNRLEWLRQFFFVGNALCHPSSMVRRAVHDEVGLYNERLGQVHDFELWIRICLRHEIHIIEENLVCFRLLRGEANASGQRPDTMARVYWESRKILDSFLAISPIDLASAFPEIRSYVSHLDEQTVPYALARLAMDNRNLASPSTCQFGVELMYTLLDPALDFDLPGRHGYMPIDLITASGRDIAMTLEAFLPAQGYLDQLKSVLVAIDAEIQNMQQQNMQQQSRKLQNSGRHRRRR